MSSVSVAQSSPVNLAQGVCVATLMLNGRWCKVFATLEDDGGKQLPFPSSLAGATMQKVGAAVEALLLFHQGKRQSEGKELKAVREITKEGVLFSGASERQGHDFKVDAVLPALSASDRARSEKQMQEMSLDPAQATGTEMWGRIEAVYKSLWTAAPASAPSLPSPIKSIDVPELPITAPKGPHAESDLTLRVEGVQKIEELPLETQIETLNRISVRFNNYLPIEGRDQELFEQFKRELAKRGAVTRESIARELESALREADYRHLSEKRALHNGVAVLVQGFYIERKPKEEMVERAKAYLEMAAASSLFNLKLFYYYIYEEARKDGVRIPDWDTQFSEFHVYDDVERFIKALIKYSKHF